MAEITVRELQNLVREKWLSVLVLAGLVVFGMVVAGGGGSVGMNLVLFICSGLLCYYDWDHFGPTVALQNGAIPAAIAWIVVLPLGRIAEPFLDSFTVLGAIIVSAAMLVALVVFLGPVGFFLGIIL